MSRSKKDKRGGHRWTRYDKEDSWVLAAFRRKRRQANKRYADSFGDENLTPDPEKSSGGWFTW